MVRGDQQRTLVTKLIQAYEWFDDALIEWMRAHGSTELTRSSSMIFSYLDPQGSRPSDLARHIGISRQAVHKTLAEMAEIGLVELVPDPDDHRAKIVMLTSRGREWVDLARRVLSDLEHELEARIGSELMAGLQGALAVDWGESPSAMLEDIDQDPERK